MSIRTVLKPGYGAYAKCHRQNLGCKYEYPMQHPLSCYNNNESLCFICSNRIGGKESFAVYDVEGAPNTRLIYHTACFEFVKLKKLTTSPEDGHGYVVLYADRPISKCIDCKRSVCITDSITVIRNNKDEEIYYCNYHFNDKCCYICGKSKPFDTFLEIRDKSKIIYQHTYCTPPSCLVCSKPISSRKWKVFTKKEAESKFEVGNDTKSENKYPIESRIKLDGSKVQIVTVPNHVHKKCHKKLVCNVCGTNDGSDLLKGDGFVADSNSYTHMNSCTSTGCSMCKKVIGGAEWTLVESGIYHKDCIMKEKCYVCHEGATPDGCVSIKHGDEFRHSECDPQICPTCKKNIGRRPYLQIDWEKYHVDCLNDQMCYLCDEHIIDGEITILKDPIGFRHSTCNPTICGKCQTPLGRMPSCIIVEIPYHLLCAPICFGCGEAGRFDRMIEHENGKFVHDDCLVENCFVCDKPLGRDFLDGEWGKNENGKPTLKTKIHTSCLVSCSKCNSNYPNTPPFDHDTYKYNYEYLPAVVEKSSIAVYGALKRRGAPRDIAKIIRKLVIILSINHGGFFGAKLSLPLRKQGRYDRRLYCNDSRCLLEKCKCCGKSGMAFSAVDKVRCTRYRCALVAKLYRTVMTDVFSQNEYLRSDWPDTEEDGSVATIETMLELRKRLDRDQIFLYTVLKDDIRDLTAKRVSSTK